MKSYLTFETKEKLQQAKAIGIYFDHIARMWYTTDIVNFRKIEKYYNENSGKLEKFAYKKAPKKKMCYEKGYKKPIKNKA
jgi:hypothetical protein